jgi:hypothetical protein
MTSTERPTHHWVRIEDVDLALILNGPDGGTDLNPEPWLDWIDEVIDIIEDGLETA